MNRPKNKEFSLKAKIDLIRKSGIQSCSGIQSSNENSLEKDDVVDEDHLCDSLDERIKKILSIVQDSPIKATEMIALIMYDIENTKVRTLIAKYLLEKGCVRIQKSVYMIRAENKHYREISKTMEEIQSCYDNNDSIILVPIPANTPGSMKIIGKDLQIDTLVNKPNILYF